jgi:hypothetical protein
MYGLFNYVSQYSLNLTLFIDNTTRFSRYTKAASRRSSYIMSFNAVASQIRIRLLIFFLALTWLSIAGLSSALAHFAVVLRDRARSDRTKGSMLSITFENVMTDIFKSMVILALLSALFSTFGGVLLIHPRLLQRIAMPTMVLAAFTSF